MTTALADELPVAEPTGTVPPPARPMSRTAAAVLASGVYLVPFALSRSTTPTPGHPTVSAWYYSLRQPAFKPPDVVIPLAWGGLQTGLAVAAYRLLRSPSSPARTRALGWLTGNVFAIGGWSRLFFGGRNLPGSTVAAATMIATGSAYVAEARSVDKVAAAAGVPFMAWVGFATVLTAAIWRLNR